MLGAGGVLGGAWLAGSLAAQVVRRETPQLAVHASEATYEVAFGRWELGYAAAAAEVLFTLVLAITLLQYWTVTRREAQA